jgi:hypothetical protein
MEEFIMLRTYLRRPDLREQYEPYWLLMRRHKKSFFSALKAVKRLVCYPSTERWRAATDKLARQAWEDVQ